MLIIWHSLTIPAENGIVMTTNRQSVNQLAESTIDYSQGKSTWSSSWNTTNVVGTLSSSSLCGIPAVSSLIKSLKNNKQGAVEKNVSLT